MNKRQFRLYKLGNQIQWDVMENGVPTGKKRAYFVFEENGKACTYGWDLDRDSQENAEKQFNAYLDATDSSTPAKAIAAT